MSPLALDSSILFRIDFFAFSYSCGVYCRVFTQFGDHSPQPIRVAPDP